MEGEQTPREKAIQSQITAWEDKEKARKDNKAEKQILSVDAWENSKKASREADYKKNEAIAEKVRLKGIEKIKNKEAQTQMEVESKKANIEAKREKAKKEVEEKAEKHRQNKTIPMKCFGGGMCKD